jgi:mono/diheme cytochrome c family protein
MRTDHATTVAASGAVLAILIGAAAPAAAADAATAITDARLAEAWRTLREIDCARCHGKDYEGQAAPSIVAYARAVDRDLFIRMILDGDPPRGMPGYRGNPRIAERIDDIYRYFAGRADGSIAAGARPASK